MVEGDKVKTAIRAITDAEYTKCTDQDCPELGQDRHPHLDWLPENTWEERDAKFEAIANDLLLHRFHPVAEAHFHIPRHYIVSLYRKSHLLWWLREIPAGAPAPDDPDIVHSTHSARLTQRRLGQWPGPIDKYSPLSRHGRSYGPWSKRYRYPVKILSPRAHIEAVILLLCRDFHVERRLDFKWFSMLCNLGERKIGTQSAARYKLKDEFQPFWDQFRGHVQVADDANIFAPLFELRDQLIAEGRLPDLPRGNPETQTLYRFELTEDYCSDPGKRRAHADKRRGWLYYKFGVPVAPRFPEPIPRPCFEVSFPLFFS